MSIAGTKWARRVIRRMVSRRPPRALILMYHRVAETKTDPWSLCVSPSHFAEQFEVLQERSTCLRLADLARSLRNGKLPRRAIALTFDDGYADNYHTAKPLLEQYGLPATFFLTTGLLGSQREFWWDELGRLLLRPGTLPERLQLTIEGEEHVYSLGDAASYSEEAALEHRAWRAWEEAPTKRHALYRALWEKLYALPEDRKQRVLGALRAWAGASPNGRRSRRALTPQEATSLGRSDRFEIGAHTVTHPPLGHLPTAEQEREIQQSKTQLEELLDRRVTSFSYPHGDYGSETVSLVRKSGFTCACSTAPDPVEPAADVLQLPRLQVHDWDGDTFAWQLNAWLKTADDQR